MNEPPICDCGCGLPMMWHKRRDRPNGGNWQCRKKHCESSRRYQRANPDREKERRRRWKKANPDRVQEINARNNARRLIVCGMYLGMVGFTQREMEGMLNGSSD